MKPLVGKEVSDRWFKNAVGLRNFLSVLAWAFDAPVGNRVC